MARRSAPAKREILPDPVYNSLTVSKFVNILMERGKKATAERILYGALEIVAKKSGEEALEAFQKALNNIKPSVEVKSRRVGGATYQVPVEVPQNRRQSLAMRWLKTYSASRGERTMRDKLAGEILDAMNFRGAAIKKKDDVHKMAEANKAFAHFRGSSLPVRKEPPSGRLLPRKHLKHPRFCFRFDPFRRPTWPATPP